MARIRTQTGSGKPTTLREFLLRQDPAWLADELLRIAEADPLVAARLKAAAGRTGQAWWTCPDCDANWTQPSFPVALSSTGRRGATPAASTVPSTRWKN